MIEGIHGVARQPQSQASRDTLGQPEFLRLMITQFQNQDPFKPMDSGDFLGQIAQFGTVSGIQDLQGSFAGLADSLISHQALQGAALIGREALVDTDIMRFNGSAIPGAVDVPVDGKVSIVIYDEAGSLVRRMDFGSQAAGMMEFAWDGRDAAGDTVPHGRYFVEAEFELGGTTYALETLMYGRVDSVSLGHDGGGLRLHIDNLGEIALARVRRISD